MAEWIMHNIEIVRKTTQWKMEENKQIEKGRMKMHCLENDRKVTHWNITENAHR